MQKVGKLRRRKKNGVVMRGGSESVRKNYDRYFLPVIICLQCTRYTRYIYTRFVFTGNIFTIRHCFCAPGIHRVYLRTRYMYLLAILSRLPSDVV